MDNYAQPPAQNPDMFEQLTNIMPVTTGTVQRRWGYQLWNSTNPVVAKHAVEFQNQVTGVRRILLAAADGTGTGSAANRINSYLEDGTFDTTVLTPSAGASSPYIVNSRGYAYIEDGVLADQKKWDGSTLTNWGIAAPTTAPSVLVQSSVSMVWSALTEFSTMGIVYDSGSTSIQQLISVNASGLNTSQIGTSGTGQLVWNQTKGGTTTDGTITWTNVGQIAPWTADTPYTYRQPIYDQASGGVYVQFTNSTITSSATRPPFTGVSGTIAKDPGVNDWACIGNVASLNSGVNQDIRIWTPSTPFQKFDQSPSGVVEPIALPAFGSPLPTQPIYLQLAVTAGGTSGTATAPSFSATSGNTAVDNDLTWLSLGSGTWVANTAVTPWAETASGTPFTAIKDPNGNIQICTTASGNTGAGPTWATGFGQVTPDGANVTWTNVGVPITWASNTKWFLPVGGFINPTNVLTLGGTEIVDSHTNKQFVTASGKSGAGAPSWNITLAGTTTDGTVTWTNDGAFVSEPGSITLIGGRNYFITFHNAVTGNYSDLSPVSASTGAITNDSVNLVGIPVSPDSQVTDATILATTDGGDQTLLYRVGAVPNGVTAYVDITSETDLLDNNIYQETDQFGNIIGVANNQPPINGKFTIYHRGRLYMLVDEALLFSKALSDLITSTGTICGRFEECWGPGGQLPISGIAETPRGIATDGTALYIGSERRIHRLLGDGPTNYNEPEVIFNEAGILNQEVWKTVFVQDEPVGMMWLTPDFRVIGSDFNTYQDAGEEIQTTLNSINSAAAQTSWAMFASNGQYDLYILAIPTGVNTVPDTLCVFNMNTEKWVVWTPTDLISAGVFNIDVNGVPQWIFTASSGTAYKFAPNLFQDRISNTPVSYAATARTSWFAPFDLSSRKLLNELQVMGDASMLVTVEGANTAADFTAPTVLVSSATLTTNVFGDYIIPLLGTPTRFRYYRLTFTATNTTQDLLDGYSFEVIPFNRV